VFLLQAAQAPPPTEVYLANLEVDRFPLIDGRAINISNNADYDNQPSFTPDGRAVLLTSKRDGKQTDIYRYDIDAKTLTQLTHTPESEYSPTITPDGRTFSVVRVEADGTQRLWRFDLDGSDSRLVLETIKPVGYHVWIDATHLGLFVLGESGQPNTLQIADTATGTAKTVASNIGRSLHMRPGKNVVTFVSKISTPWMIREVSPATGAIADIVPALEGSEDFVWNNQFSAERLFMARGSKVFVRLTPSRDGAWREAGDFAGAGIESITRLAIRPQGQPALAVVGEPRAAR